MAEQYTVITNWHWRDFTYRGDVPAKVLADEWSYGDRPRLHAIDFEPLAADIRERTERRYWQVVLKRLMLRAAAAVARERRALVRRGAGRRPRPDVPTPSPTWDPPGPEGNPPPDRP